VLTLDFTNLPRTEEDQADFAQDFFGREAFLTSGAKTTAFVRKPLNLLDFLQSAV
jgi:hypothetical protein